MALSSVSVVLSSLHLSTYRPPVGSVAAAVARRRGEIAGVRELAREPRRYETELADGGGGYAVGVTP